jgi:hypothetical protein
MQYTIKRGEQTFGPYSLTDLQQYVQSGNIAATDLARSEGMTDWLQVSHILGNIPAPAASSATTVDIPAQLVPLPPNLHWSLVLLLGIFTRQLFNLIWALIQANWARKLSGNNKAMVLVAMYPASMVAGIMVMIFLRDEGLAPLGGLLILAGAIVYLFGVFTIRSDMEDYYNSTENIGLSLSGVMTFFFSTVYLQYHINRLHRWKKSGTEFPA